MLSERDHSLFDLLNDPTCLALMKRDGVKHHEVIKLMRSVKPLAGRCRPSILGNATAAAGA